MHGYGYTNSTQTHWLPKHYQLKNGNQKLRKSKKKTDSPTRWETEFRSNWDKWLTEIRVKFHTLSKIWNWTFTSYKRKNHYFVFFLVCHTDKIKREIHIWTFLHFHIVQISKITMSIKNELQPVTALQISEQTTPTFLTLTQVSPQQNLKSFFPPKIPWLQPWMSVIYSFRIIQMMMKFWACTPCGIQGHAFQNPV